MKSNRFINTLTMLATIAAFCLASFAVDVQAQDDLKEKPKAEAPKVQSLSLIHISEPTRPY